MLARLEAETGDVDRGQASGVETASVEGRRKERAIVCSSARRDRSPRRPDRPWPSRRDTSLDAGYFNHATRLLCWACIYWRRRCGSPLCTPVVPGPRTCAVGGARRRQQGGSSPNWAAPSARCSSTSTPVGPDGAHLLALAFANLALQELERKASTWPSSTLVSTHARG